MSAIQEPPIQERTTNESGLFPQIWVQWFLLVTQCIGRPGFTDITSDTTLPSARGIYIVDTTSADVTLALPSAASSEGVLYDIKKADASANTVTINPNGSETIDNNTSVVHWLNRIIIR